MIPSTRRRSGARRKSRGGCFARSHTHTHSPARALPQGGPTAPLPPRGAGPGAAGVCPALGSAPGPESPAAVRADPVSLMAPQCCLPWLRPQAPEASGADRSLLRRPRSRPCRETCYRAGPPFPFPAPGRRGTFLPSPWSLPSLGPLPPRPPPFLDLPSSPKGWWELRLFHFPAVLPSPPLSSSTSDPLPPSPPLHILIFVPAGTFQHQPKGDCRPSLLLASLPADITVPRSQKP